MCLPVSAFRIVGRSDVEGQFEVQKVDSGIVVYAWPGCTATDYDGDVAVLDLSIPVPGIPAGMAMSEFVGTLFGEGGAGLATDSQTRRPWWRFW